MKCGICNKTLEEQGAWKQMTGWVSPHGAKALTLSEPTGEMAHASCIFAKKSGVIPGQMDIFGNVIKDGA